MSRHPTFVLIGLSLAVGLLAAPFPACRAQSTTPEIVRTPPPPRDDLEEDDNGDGVPDGWYNARDVAIETKGGASGPKFLRFNCERRGRPARLSRAFGVDGQATEAIVIGLWIRLKNVEYGERMGETPSLLIDFLGDELRTLARGTMGPWSPAVGDRWTWVAKRIAVPPGTKDSIMSVGLLGAAGRLDVDGLTFTLIPRKPTETTNLVVNGDFELGDPAPAYWIVNHEAHRTFPGRDSVSAIELSKSGDRVLTGLALPVDGVAALEISLSAKAQALRGGGGAVAAFYFLDPLGDPIPGVRGVPAFQWAGSFDWRAQRAQVQVPQGAHRAVVQFEKLDGIGSIRIDDVEVVSAPTPELTAWTPFQTEDDVLDWLKLPPSTTIAAGSALDFSFLHEHAAGSSGFVEAKDGRLQFSRGGRARFFGVSLIAPAAFLEPERADALADRLSRSGVNLVRLGDLDTPLGPDRSLIDDTRDDTKEFDPNALERLDHLIAALKSRGVYVAVELGSSRRFRADDGVESAGLLPAGGGPAAIIDPVLDKLTLDSSLALLGHVNGETKLALRDDPALAWVTLAGETTLFDLIDNPDALPSHYAAELRKRAERTPGGAGRRFWQHLESAHWSQRAEALRKSGVKAPIAGVSHWRREPEFVDALAAPGLDLIDDRLYWAPSSWISPERRSQLWDLDGGLNSGAGRKQTPGKPYVVGQWCPQTGGAWALPHEAADQLLAAVTASHDDWDALVRRGVFVYPRIWGEGPAGTVGGEDIFQIPEVANASPQVYALWPHAASILLRGRAEKPHGRAADRRRRPPTPGWDPVRAVLTVDTPFTQGLAGWIGGRTASFPTLKVSSATNFAVVVASSVGDKPIDGAERLLVSVVAQVEPTGFRWVDPWKRDVADPGRPPLLQQPAEARVEWLRKGPVKGYVLDNAGNRVGPARLEPLSGGEGVALVVDGRTPAFHWELVVE